jgi:hypothetical protein
VKPAKLSDRERSEEVIPFTPGGEHRTPNQEQTMTTETPTLDENIAEWVRAAPVGQNPLIDDAAAFIAALTAENAKLASELAEAKGERDELIAAAKAAIPEAEHPSIETYETWAWQIRTLGEDRRAAYRNIAELHQQLAAERARRESEPSGWRDIGKAPKDGTRIIGFADDGRYKWWSCTRWVNFPDGGCGWIGESFTSKPENAWTSIVNPTHWQPLPPPPATQEPR